MQKILFRRVLRDLKTNLFRYLALFFLILFSMFLVIGTMGAAQSIIGTIDEKAEKNRLEDGQFGVLMPLNTDAEKELEALGATIEACFYMDFELEDNSVLRVMKNRQNINLVEIQEGRQAEQDQEIVLERLYASSHQLLTGDYVNLAGREYKISGIGTSPDYEYCLKNMGDMASDSRLFGTAFVTPETYETLRNSNIAAHAEEYRYSYLLGAQTDEDGLFEAVPKEPAILTDFVKASDNPRIKAAGADLEINLKIGIMAGIIVLVLITYVISVFIIHSIDRESAMIGALYALGVKRNQLMLHYTLLPVMLCLLGGVLGTLSGYSKLGFSMMEKASCSYYSVPAIDTFYSPWLLCYGFVLPPLIAFAVNLLIIRRRLNRNALSLLRKEQPEKHSDRLTLSRFGFLRAFQIRQILREKRSSLAILAGMFVSLLILMLGLNCYALCKNIQLQNAADTKFSYMYQYKYPSAEVPKGGYAAYVKGLNQEVMGYDMEITLTGLTDGNPFFPSITSSGKNEVSLSSSAAMKYGLDLGDELILHDRVNKTSYTFNVKEVVPYSVGLFCFMEKDSMLSLFGQKDSYYNVVYSDHALNIGPNRLYSTTTREDIKKTSEIFMEIMRPLMTMMTAAAVLIFLIVMYQMMKVMTDNSSFGISLMKIFGYRGREIRKLYLDGHFMMTAAASLLMLPVAKYLMDKVYPYFTANVAGGIDTSWPPALYVLVYSGILLFYLLIRTVLMRRLKKMNPGEILKDRD